MKSLKTFFTKIIFFALLFLLFIQNSNSQTFNFTSIDASKFPEVRGLITAKDLTGTDYTNLAVADFELWENGISMNPTLQVDCRKVDYFFPINVTLVLDVSYSMNEIAPGGEKKIDWVRAGARAFVDSFKFVPPSSLAIITFCGNVTNYSGFYQTAKPCYDYLDTVGLVAAGATNFNHPFLRVAYPPGCIEALKTRPANIKRIVVFITDGKHEVVEPFRYDEVIQKCKDEKIVVYPITVATNMNSELSWIANETGGKSYACFSKTDMIKRFREIIGDIQNRNICELVWQAPFGCDEPSRSRNVLVKFKRIPDSVRTSYVAPPESIANVTVSDNLLMFGKPGSGLLQRNLTITAPKTDFTISGATFSPDNGYFTIDWNGKNPPFVLGPNQTHTIKINYIEDPPSASHSTMLQIQGTPCDPPEVELVAPCGGDFVAQYDFSNVPISTSADQNFNCIFKNTTATEIRGNAILDGANKDEFEILLGAGPFTLMPNDCHKMSIRFKPQSIGSKSAYIQFNIPTECGDPRTQLLGTGMNTSFPMPTMDWKERRLLTTNDSTYKLHNSSPVKVKITKIYMKNTPDNNFIVNLPTAPFEIEPDAEVDIPLSFIPQSEGVLENFITIELESVPNPISGRLTGIGALPMISTKELVFPPTKPAVKSSIENLEIENPSTTSDLFIYEIKFAQPTTEFAFETPNLTNLKVARNGGKLDIPMSFTPASVGIRTAKVLIISDALPGPDKAPRKYDTVNISGEGLGLNVSPRSIDFGEVLTCFEPQQKLKIINSTSNTKIVIYSKNIVGSNQFVVSGLPDTIPAGVDYNFDIIFMPQTPGNYQGTLQLRTSSGDADIILNGQGKNVIIKPTIQPIPKALQIPNSRIPVIFTLSVPNFENNKLPKVNFTFEYYDKMFLIDENTLNMSASKGTWNWTMNCANGICTITGTSSDALPPLTINGSIIFATYLSDKAETFLIITPEFQELAIPSTSCFDYQPDSQSVRLATCYTNGRLITINPASYYMTDIKPNPAQNEIEIAFGIGLEAQTKIDIYNSMGILVANIFDQSLKSGEYLYKFPIDLPSGVYIVNIRSGIYNDLKKLIINR